MTIVTPTGDTLKPWILNCTPSGVSSPATTGIDRFNNYEQITLNNPAAGIYTIVTKGSIVTIRSPESMDHLGHHEHRD
jgi:hypothetical protein